MSLVQSFVNTFPLANAIKMEATAPAVMEPATTETTVSLATAEAPAPAQEEPAAAANAEPSPVEAEVVAPAQEEAEAQAEEPKPKRGFFFLCCATNKSKAAAAPVDEKEIVADVPSEESKEGPAEAVADETTAAVVQDAAPEAPCCA